MGLVLTRKLGEKIRIGDDVVLTIMGYDRGNVKVVIEAPIAIPVHREEVYQRIAADRKQ